MPFRPLLLSLILAVPPCWAEVPEFDRPGISFPTSTIPAGSFAIEQGLPDLSYDSGSGLRTTEYGFDTVVRVGVAAHTELQLITALYNRLDQHDASGSHHAGGSGDTGLALKLGLPGNDDRRSLGFLATLMLPTGDAEFSAGEASVSLGTTASFALGETQSLSLYANLDREDERNAWTLASDIGFELSETVGSFVEAGATLARGDDDYIAGGGFTWLVVPTVQLDIYADLGLTARSTDLQAGLGVSVYFE